MAKISPSLEQAGSREREEFLWPECVDFWEVWMQLQTQWRTGAMGATGLDYAGVRVWLDEVTRFDPDERRELWQCIQACESATLVAWADRRERDEQQRALQQSAPRFPGR